MIHDQEQRQQALDVTKSFIVQAPAGSGKTELLIQRFLSLLTSVNQPEEVVALTFTNKAANEMRERLIRTLRDSEHLTNSPSSHQQKTGQLAKEIIRLDEKNHWNLLDNPHRLRVQTLDAFCTGLVRLFPFSSGLGTGEFNTDDLDTVYLVAAKRITDRLEDKHFLHQTDLSHLLLHLNNDIRMLQTLLVNMLKKRDQWLRLITQLHQNTEKLKIILEDSLREFNQSLLNSLNQLIDSSTQLELWNLVCYAHKNSQTEPKSPLYQINLPTTFPANTIDDLNAWRIIIKLLLTDKKEWRKALNKNIGFPEKTEEKKLMLDIIIKISSDHLLSTLQQVSLNLPLHYDSYSWSILLNLFKILPSAVGELQDVFKQTGKIDFIELNQSALKTLRIEDDMPTDLALALDYKIKHLLIDEFQDTSYTQFNLLEYLVEGWSNDDGKTLFLVGDPMQSIYRFRAAEVGLFLQAKDYGIGSLSLDFIKLSSNFRSSHTIVEWINQNFSHIFPQKNDALFGAITYSPASATRETAGEVIGLQCTNNTGRTIVEIIESLYKNNKTQSIAILVRQRNDLHDILPHLDTAAIPYQAVDIALLTELPLIQDLLNLTKALCDLNDRLAWLATLRAPWCGLTLSDIHLLAQHKDHLIWQSCQESPTLARLSVDGQLRLSKILPILTSAILNKGRLSLSQWVKATWLALQGDKLALSYNINCDVFFECLEKIQLGGFLPDVKLLENALEKLYAKPSINPHAIQIMTIHKAKGLEFDTVILPHLEKKTRPDSSELLLWQEFPLPDQQPGFLIAPIRSSEESEKDPIYEYINQIQKHKNQLENARVFYVATTRARERLYLLADFVEEKTSFTNSFLELCIDRINFTPLLKEDHPIENIIKQTSQRMKMNIIEQHASLLPRLDKTDFTEK